MKKGQRVRVVEGTPVPHAHPNDPDILGLVGTVTGRSLQGMIEVRLPWPGTGKPFGFLLNPDQLELVP
jgi:hypothetical protein